MEKQKKRNFAGVFFLKIMPLVIISWMVVYTVAYTLAVRKQVKNMQLTVANDTLSYSKEEWMLIREKAFLQSRIIQSGSDSIGLTLNLRDSLVQVETKGVVLRQVRFDKAEISPFFRSFRPGSYSAFFSKPFGITEIEGTIVKEPIIVKKAPRDSVEAAQSSTQVDTTQSQFVEWHLQLDSILIISFVQSDKDKGGIDWPTLEYRFRRHAKTLTETNLDLISFMKPTYFPEITVFIPRKEAKSFYRALPQNGRVVMTF
jgi:hypothetical protein